MSLAAGDRCFVEEDYEGAVEHYTTAIAEKPDAAVYLSRASAFSKLESYQEAVQDASRALELGNRTLKAYQILGVAYFHLEEYESAKEYFEQGLQVFPQSKELKKWLAKCDAELEDEEQNESKPSPSANNVHNQAQHAPVTSPPASAAPQAAMPPAAAAGVQPSTSKPIAPLAPEAQTGKYRHQWYQLPGQVVVDVYAKNLAKEQVLVTFSDTRLLLIIKDEHGEEDYSIDVELYGPINPSLSKYEVLRSKIEVTMRKADNTQWGTLHKSGTVAAPNYSDPSLSIPSYPTSYKRNPKDWDKVESELKDLEQKGELEDGDPLSSFFKKIFSQGDEDQRRAMMKSFTESNGTVLSTNWEEVGKKSVECTPPEGMEVHKWTDS